METVPPFSLPRTNRRVLLIRRPVGIPQADDFVLDEALVPVPGEGELLVRNIYLSVDPAQRGWASDVANYSAPVAIGDPMRSLAVGQILESRVAGIAPGSFAYGWFGWQDYAAVAPAAVVTLIGQPLVPLSAYAGPLGINGLTAKLAFEGLGRPRIGETVLVSTAAGAVGSLVGQLARRAGCGVIGLAGGAQKTARCTARFGYHRAIDYKAGNLAEAIAGAAPEGVDIYFDNVGGTTLDVALRTMRVGGRIVQCGTSSVANWSPTPVGPRAERELLTRRLSWTGFVVFDHEAHFAETGAALTDMIRAGELVYDEDIDAGIEAAPGAIARLYAGENLGKKLVFIGGGPEGRK